jgi:hypothetical protein
MTGRSFEIPGGERDRPTNPYDSVGVLCKRNGHEQHGLDELSRHAQVERRNRSRRWNDAARHHEVVEPTDFSEQAFHICLAAGVSTEDAHVRRPAKRVARFAKFVDGPCDEHDACSTIEKRRCRTSANPGASTDNHDGLAFESHDDILLWMNPNLRQEIRSFKVSLAKTRSWHLRDPRMTRPARADHGLLRRIGRRSKGERLQAR